MRTIGLFVLSVLIGILSGVSSTPAYEADDSLPEVTARVARISFIRGDVQMRRKGSQDWETAELNLPIVEGDEIVTEHGARAEIQFNKDTHVRLSEDSLLQIRQLSESGIAVSIARGVVNARIRKFSTDREFFEIDAPSTTVAVQREGVYRVDAGTVSESEVRVSATEGGEARVYSTGSGFTLRSGRSAKVFIDGANAGEWETNAATASLDEFDSWSLERDELITKALSSSHYDKYYDQDIYAAEELNDNGSWEYTSDYGYVWQPYASAISVYHDWSPYRYGSWRWVPPFGWTWVNQERWGWATYHHGRWVWYRGHWVWTPYAYYRTNRSWWFPALVVIQVVNKNVCWYPLGYRHRYHDYNRYHDWVGNRDRRRGAHDDDDRSDGRRYDRRPNGTATTSSPVPAPSPVVAGARPRGRLPMDVGGSANPASDTIPPNGVVSLPEEVFGSGRRVGQTVPPVLARTILSKAAQPEDSPVELPNYDVIRKRNGNGTPIMPEAVKRVNLATRIGASERRMDVPLDAELRRTRILGDRQPVSQPVTPEVSVPGEPRETPRRTGAVTRPPTPRREIERNPAEGNTPPVNETPAETGNRRVRNPRFERPSKDAQPQNDDPAQTQPGQIEETPAAPREVPPRIERPQRRPTPRDEAPRTDAPPRVETPRNDPPAPRVERPRNDPPPTEPAPQPRNDPPPRREAPPQTRSDPPPRRESQPRREQPKNDDPPPRPKPGPITRKLEKID